MAGSHRWTKDPPLTRTPKACRRPPSIPQPKTTPSRRRCRSTVAAQPRLWIFTRERRGRRGGRWTSTSPSGRGAAPGAPPTMCRHRRPRGYPDPGLPTPPPPRRPPDPARHGVGEAAAGAKGGVFRSGEAGHGDPTTSRSDPPPARRPHGQAEAAHRAKGRRPPPGSAEIGRAHV